MAKRLKSSESLKRVIAGAQPQGGVTPGSEPAVPTRHCPPRPAKQTTPLRCPRSGALNGPHLPRGGATPGRGRSPSPAAPSRTGSFPPAPHRLLTAGARRATPLHPPQRRRRSKLPPPATAAAAPPTARGARTAGAAAIRGRVPQKVIIRL